MKIETHTTWLPLSLSLFLPPTSLFRAHSLSLALPITSLSTVFSRQIVIISYYFFLAQLFNSFVYIQTLNRANSDRAGRPAPRPYQGNLDKKYGKNLVHIFIRISYWKVYILCSDGRKIARYCKKNFYLIGIYMCVLFLF